MPQLIAELKRRDVLRAAAFYAAGDSITQWTAKALDRWIIATLALIVVLPVAAKLDLIRAPLRTDLRLQKLIADGDAATRAAGNP